MTGEQFLAVLAVGFGAFIIWLIVQIINREPWAVPIAVGIDGLGTF